MKKKSACGNLSLGFTPQNLASGAEEGWETGVRAGYWNRATIDDRQPITDD